MGPLGSPGHRGPGMAWGGQCCPMPVSSNLYGPPAMTASSYGDLLPSPPAPSSNLLQSKPWIGLFLPWSQEKRRVTFTFLLILSFSNVNREGRGLHSFLSSTPAPQQTPSSYLPVRLYATGRDANGTDFWDSLKKQGG